MLSGDVLSIGCLTLASITIFFGSYYLPKHSCSYSRRGVVSDDLRSNAPQPPFLLSSYEEYRIRAEIDRAIARGRGLAPSGFGQTHRNTTRTLVQNWRRSIIGLIALSDRNLTIARERLQAGDEKRAVQNACTAVENVARALIHCCGGKPDSDGGQEEVLRMLSKRFKPETKREFDNALVKLTDMVSGEPKRILRLAPEVAETFKRIIVANFEEEIGDPCAPAWTCTSCRRNVNELWWCDFGQRWICPRCCIPSHEECRRCDARSGNESA